jgi:beta-hydroxylase
LNASVRIKESETGLRPNSGAKPGYPSRIPDVTAVSGAPHPDDELKAEGGRPLILRVGKHLRGFFDALISSS